MTLLLSNLPPEIINEILRYVDNQTLFNCYLANKFFHVLGKKEKRDRSFHLDMRKLHTLTITNEGILSSKDFDQMDYPCNYPTMDYYERIVYESELGLHPYTEPMTLAEVKEKYDDNRLAEIKPIRKGKKCRYSISRYSHAYQYLKCDHLDQIERIELTIGGRRINSLPGRLFAYLRHFHGIEDETIIPFFIFEKGLNVLTLAFHDVYLEVEFKTVPNEEVVFTAERMFYDWKLALRMNREPHDYIIFQCNGGYGDILDFRKHSIIKLCDIEGTPFLNQIIMEFTDEGGSPVKYLSNFLQLELDLIHIDSVDEFRESYNIQIDEQKIIINVPLYEIFDNLYIFRIARDFSKITEHVCLRDAYVIYNSSNFNEDRIVAKCHSIGANVYRNMSGMGGVMIP